MEGIRFEWDETKNQINKVKHGIGFEEAQTVFYDDNAIMFSVFDKGIITRHLKNGANLHETATIGETQSGGFFCDMAGVHWGCPVLVIKAAPSRPRPFHPQSQIITIATLRQNDMLPKRQTGK